MSYVSSRSKRLFDFVQWWIRRLWRSELAWAKYTPESLGDWMKIMDDMKNGLNMVQKRNEEMRKLVYMLGEINRKEKAQQEELDVLRQVFTLVYFIWLYGLSWFHQKTLFLMPLYIRALQARKFSTTSNVTLGKISVKARPRPIFLSSSTLVSPMLITIPRSNTISVFVQQRAPIWQFCCPYCEAGGGQGSGCDKAVGDHRGALDRTNIYIHLRRTCLESLL